VAPKKQKAALAEGVVEPPAKKVRGKKAAAAPEGVVAAAESAVAHQDASTGTIAAPEAMKCNGEIFAKHLQNVRVFREQAVAQDLVQMKPQNSGFLQVFDAQKALAALKQEGRYQCCINLMWLDQSYSTSPHVPLNQGAIPKLKAHFFSKPQRLEQQALTVAILQAELDAGTFPAVGTWKRVSPEESVMAWFEAASDDAALFRDGAAEKEADVQEWLRHCLSTSCLIKVVDSLGELQWVSAQLREDMSQLAVLQRTPTQRIFDVVSKKESMGTNFTAEALVQLYDKKLKWSSTAEKLSIGCLSI